MRLRTALNEFKRARDDDFAGEARTVTGAFSGHGDRLVYVDRSGFLRDYSAALSGLYGVDRSRFGIETAEGTFWLDDLDTVRQHYYRETTLVETEYDAGDFTVHQYDLTLGRAHVTHVELRGAVPSAARLVAFLTLAPEGRETGIGRLVHEDGGGPTAVEVYHREEHDYVTASTGLDEVRGQVPERFEEVLADEAYDFPREAVLSSYEDAHLSGDVVVTAPLEREGRAARTTLVTQLSDHDAVDRSTALADVRTCAAEHRSASDVRGAARERAAVAVAEDAPRPRQTRDDLRVLDMLTAPSGATVSAPEYDPFYAHSGGYGYAWFRDNALVARHLLESADVVDRDVGPTMRRTAQFFCATQLDDGTWPHRAWATDGSLAPGWANGTLERGGDATEYQADQTARATAFLATLLRERRDALSPGDVDAVREAVAAAVDAMVDHLADNDLPGRCQHVWEDGTGQFAHAAGTYLEAFAAVGRAPVGEAVREASMDAAERVLDGLDLLWTPDSGRYATALRDGHRDVRYDAATLALVDGLVEYGRLADAHLPDGTVERVAAHVEATLDGLSRDPAGSEVAGLVRYAGDDWRTGDQDAPKVWSLTTAMGASAAVRLGRLLDRRGEGGEAFLERARDLFALVAANGPLTTDAGYLPDQHFDDGTPDSACPRALTHAVRLHTTGLLAAEDALPSTTTLPEGPSERPRWTTGEKYGLGTVADHGDDDPSRVWFTLTEGALTEVRFPRVDLMNLRTLDFLVRASDPEDSYTVRTHNESRRDDEADTVERHVRPAADDALLFEQVVTETGDGSGHAWRLTVEYATDPDHDAVVANVDFEAEDGAEYDLFAVGDVALTNTGTEDRGLRLGRPGSHHLVARDAGAYTGETERPLLVDDDGEGYSVAVALTAAGHFDWATVGVAGTDRLRELFSESDLPESQERVDNENVVLVGRLGTGSRVDRRVALGFARHADTAAALGEAAGALSRPYEEVSEAYADSWRAFLADKELPDAVADDPALANQYRTALMTLLAVEDKTYLGASIASPSVPWGEAVAATEPRGYGYNFVWARDLYQVFTAFTAAGELERAVDQLRYIYEYQQDETGFIPQNTYVNGVTRWGGEQMDNISFPQVMAYHLREAGYGFEDVPYSYEDVRRSANYVSRNGPETAQERWEEEAGYSPSSIAAEVAGLVCAGTLALDAGHEADGLVWLALADHWANEVETWTASVTGTDRHGHTPYYVRVTRDGDPDAGHLRTLANDGPTLDERDIIDGGFLELVRLGIKPWDDDVVRNTLVEVDDTIRVDTPGAAFYRYNGDGYGERERGDKGAPWSAENHGKGRLWPLLTGERGEYELLAGGTGPLDPRGLLETMQEFANSGRMIAEQVWDREYGTPYNWEFGEGTGSATPLAWSMAQFVRLAHGLDAGEPVETPDVVRERYVEDGVHEPDKGPALRVDTHFEGDTLVVSGETTGAVVAITTPTDRAVVDVAEGGYEARLGIEHGENLVTVAAATGRPLEDAGTTVRRITL